LKGVKKHQKQNLTGETFLFIISLSNSVAKLNSSNKWSISNIHSDIHGDTRSDTRSDIRSDNRGDTRSDTHSLTVLCEHRVNIAPEAPTATL